LNHAVGGLTLAGWLMGVVSKGSKASLIPGSTFGRLLLLSACLVSSSKKGGKLVGIPAWPGCSRVERTISRIRKMCTRQFSYRGTGASIVVGWLMQQGKSRRTVGLFLFCFPRAAVQKGGDADDEGRIFRLLTVVGAGQEGPTFPKSNCWWPANKHCQAKRNMSELGHTSKGGLYWITSGPPSPCTN
jgi:uncharacterized membrane protein (UPF0136 family)